MTAEIAILNKSAVALAADSAVSIGQPPNMKIYNTVNKIFELSSTEPSGVMIYGNLDFMGLPFETIIKEYRRKLGRTSFPTVSAQKDHFLRYLETEVPVEAQHEAMHFGSIILDALTQLNSDINDLIFKNMISKGKFQKSKTNGIAQDHLKRKITELKLRPFAPGYRRAISLDGARSLVDQLIEMRMRDCFPNETTKEMVRKYIALFLAKSSLSSIRTGIVFAGFGTKELCPSLESVEIDGIVDGKLKSISTNSIDIGRQTIEAHALGFAQDDMVKTFLHGIDPDIRKYFNNLVSRNAIDTAGVILKAVLDDDAQAEVAIKALRPVLSELATKAAEKADQYITDQSTSRIIEMIRLMPKQELATLAESLIELTSLKRKVTRTQETVGGEVDVAVISKSEGFIWIKRKHYFKQDLNPRFFVRHYDRQKGDVP